MSELTNAPLWDAEDIIKEAWKRTDATKATILECIAKVQEAKRLVENVIRMGWNERAKGEPPHHWGLPEHEDLYMMAYAEVDDPTDGFRVLAKKFRNLIDYPIERRDDTQDIIREINREDTWHEDELHDIRRPLDHKDEEA